MKASREYTTFEAFLINTLDMSLYKYRTSYIDVGLNDDYEDITITDIDEIFKHDIRLETKTSSPNIRFLQIAVTLMCEIEFSMDKGTYFSEYHDKVDADEESGSDYVCGYTYEEINVEAYVTLDIKKGVVSKVDILSVNPSFV